MDDEESGHNMSSFQPGAGGGRGGTNPHGFPPDQPGTPGPGAGAKKPACPGIAFSVLWFFAIFVIGFPVASLLTFIYLILLPFAGCIPALREVCKGIIGLVNFPYKFAKNMVAMEDCNGAAWDIHDGP